MPLASDWDVFASKGCAGCHRIRGIGDGTVGPDLGRIDSGTGFIEIAAAMWNHVAEMRVEMRERSMAWPRFTPQEFSNLIEFLFTAQLHDIARDPVEGQRVFVSKGCDRCHMAGDAGGGTAPRLAELGRSTSSVLMAAAMWNHVSQMGDAMDAAGLTRTPFSRTELQDIAAYIRSTGRDPRGEPAPLVVGVPDRGRRLFVEKGGRGRRRLEAKGCLTCHSIYGRGEKSAPDFAASNVVSSKLGQVTAMWNHARHMENPAKRRATTLPTLTGQELSDITTYLAGLGRGPRPR